MHELSFILCVSNISVNICNSKPVLRGQMEKAITIQFNPKSMIHLLAKCQKLGMYIILTA